jgi:hypothetical protein
MTSALYRVAGVLSDHLCGALSRLHARGYDFTVDNMAEACGKELTTDSDEKHGTYDNVSIQYGGVP